MAQSRIRTFIDVVMGGTGAASAEADRVTNSINKSTSAVDKLNKRLKSIQAGVALQSVTAAAGAVKGAFDAVTSTIGGAVNAVYGLAASQATAADKIGKTAALLGMQVGEFQALESAGNHAGMSTEAVNSALEKFSINTAKAASGSKAQLDIFNALGVATKNADGSMRSQTELLLEAADAYTKLSSEQDKNRVSQELFGRSAVQMSALLSGGSSGLRSSIADYEATGAGYTDEEVKSAAAFNDNLQTMSENLEGIKKDLFFALAPAFTDLFQSVTEFIENNRPQIDAIISRLSKQLPSVIDDVKSALPSILDKVLKVGGVVADILEYTGPWVPMLSAAAVIVGGGLLTAVTAVGAAFVAVGAFVSGPIVAGIGLVVAAVVSWGSVVKSVYDNWDMLKSFIVDDVGGAIGRFIDDCVSKFKGFVNYVIEGVASAVGALSGLPFVGDTFAGSAAEIRSLKFDTAPSNSAVTKAATAKATNSTLNVNFSGMPKGVTVTPEKGFDYGSIDFTAGYAFGSY